jgi:predicted nucleotidyltransferase
MTAISRPLTPRPDRPVEPIALSVIQNIHKASKALGLPVFLVGAMARIILLENVHGLPPGRATTDVDFAFALDNWDQFTTITDSLLAEHAFIVPQHAVVISITSSG